MKLGAFMLALRELRMTRIVIAHRRETLAMCDRVIDLAKLSNYCADRAGTSVVESSKPRHRYAGIAVIGQPLDQGILCSRQDDVSKQGVSDRSDRGKGRPEGRPPYQGHRRWRLSCGTHGIHVWPVPVPAVG